MPYVALWSISVELAQAIVTKLQLQGLQLRNALRSAHGGNNEKGSEPIQEKIQESILCVGNCMQNNVVE